MARLFPLNSRSWCLVGNLQILKLQILYLQGTIDVSLIFRPQFSLIMSFIELVTFTFKALSKFWS